MLGKLINVNFLQRAEGTLLSGSLYPQVRVGGGDKAGQMEASHPLANQGYPGVTGIVWDNGALLVAFGFS